MTCQVIPYSELRMRQIARALREERKAMDACVVKLDEALARLRAGERLDAVPCDTEGEG